jgi:hypothetical protein
MDTEQIDSIIAAMQGRVLDGDMVSGWSKRQVEREDGSAERAKRWREAQKEGKRTQPNASEREQTPDKDKDKDKEERVERELDDASPSAQPASKKPTGTRLPENWVLPKAWGEWALQERKDWNAETVRSVAEQFADHWHAKAGADARKADWQATWRNWVRREISTRVASLPTSVTPLHDHRCRYEDNGVRCENQGVRGKNGRWYCHDHKHVLEETA